MAKAQKRSGREPKKPKKAVSLKSKAADVVSAFSGAPGVVTKHHSRKG